MIDCSFYEVILFVFSVIYIITTKIVATENKYKTQVVNAHNFDFIVVLTNWVCLSL